MSSRLLHLFLSIWLALLGFNSLLHTPLPVLAGGAAKGGGPKGGGDGGSSPPTPPSAPPSAPPPAPPPAAGGGSQNSIIEIFTTQPDGAVSAVPTGSAGNTSTSSNSGGGGGGSNSGVIVAAAVVGGLVLLTIIGIFIFRKWKLSPKRNRDFDEETLGGGGNGGLTIGPMRSLEDPTKPDPMFHPQVHGGSNAQYLYDLNAQ